MCVDCVYAQRNVIRNCFNVLWYEGGFILVSLCVWLSFCNLISNLLISRSVSRSKCEQIRSFILLNILIFGVTKNCATTVDSNWILNSDPHHFRVLYFRLNKSLQKLVEISVQLKTIQNETQNIQFAKIVITPIVHIDSEFSGIFSLCRHLYLNWTWKWTWT